MKTGQTNSLQYLNEIFEAGHLDARIDRNALALEIIKECGQQTPLYMDTSFFALMAANFFTIKQREIVRDLDALAQEYNPLEQFNVERHSGTNDKRTDDLRQTYAQGEIDTRHNVSADNETGVQLRTQDVTQTEDDTTTNTGTQTHEIKHNENESGRNVAAQDLLSSEFKANKFNIYHVIALDFSGALMVAIY